VPRSAHGITCPNPPSKQGFGRVASEWDCRVPPEHTASAAAPHQIFRHRRQRTSNPGSGYPSVDTKCSFDRIRVCGPHEVKAADLARLTIHDFTAGRTRVRGRRQTVSLAIASPPVRAWWHAGRPKLSLMGPYYPQHLRPEHLRPTWCEIKAILADRLHSFATVLPRWRHPMKEMVIFFFMPGLTCFTRPEWGGFYGICVNRLCCPACCQVIKGGRDLRACSRHHPVPCYFFREIDGNAKDSR